MISFLPNIEISFITNYSANVGTHPFRCIMHPFRIDILLIIFLFILQSTRLQISESKVDTSFMVAFFTPYSELNSVNIVRI